MDSDGQSEDKFEPNEVGTWTIQAEFADVIVRKDLEITFFVLPESPIGAIAMLLSIGRRKGHNRDHHQARCD